MEKLISYNPATGDALAELDLTSIEELPAIFQRARHAQERWAIVSSRQRAKHLVQLRETLLRHADELSLLISRENGKPRFEAMASELLPSLELLSYFAKHSPDLLNDRAIPLRLMRHRKSFLNYWPLGVVAVISPWNYPFMLPFGEIVMALVAGNAVVFKPSEVTPLIGLKIQQLCEEAGIPPHLVQTVIGDGALGAALIEQKPAKIFFTGSVPTGRKIMAAAAPHLIPVSLELGGNDAMIVLPDADLDYASSAALWGGFANSGQVCASVERILVHESIAEEFKVKLKEKMLRLRQSPEAAADATHARDLGVTTLDRQKLVYDRHLDQARAQGAEFGSGGEFGADRRHLLPTMISGSGIEGLDVYNEETFGPVVAITTFRSVAEAIEKTNRSEYGLSASVITRNSELGEHVARQLEVGTVTINEVTYTAGLPETPWGGVKQSGVGRKHAEMGFYEFVNVRHIHKPVAQFFVFKSLWWFPYTPYQYSTVRQMMELYRRSWVDKARALPHFLWNLVQFLKKEKRL